MEQHQEKTVVRLESTLARVVQERTVMVSKGRIVLVAYIAAGRLSESQVSHFHLVFRHP